MESDSDYQDPTGIFSSLAYSFGVPEPALRLLLSILAGYPLAGVYNVRIKDQTETLRHLYFASTGFLLYIFNYGFDVYHSLIAIWMTYLLVRLLYNSQYLRIINFSFHMGYLLIGYYFTESDDYDIKWTMPHCVLVLRLIALVYDISDGQLPKDELSKDQQQTALQEVPSLLELTGFSYFPASFLVGPQFPFRRYQRFNRGEFRAHKGYVEAGLKRGALGVFYLILRQIGSSYLSDTYFLTPQFKETSFFNKLMTISIWGKICLYKYISCWLLTEGALICFGFTYVGISENGEEDWSGCSNVKLFVFETASRMGHYVASFNVNTNNWVSQYIYKRLKFLGNRNISYMAALFFLAVWHGFHTGYYVCFFLEFLVITFEKQFESTYAVVKTKYGELLESSVAQAVIFILLKIYVHIGMGWCLLPFVYLSYDKWLEVFSVFNYYGIIFLFTWFASRFIYGKVCEQHFNSKK